MADGSEFLIVLSVRFALVVIAKRKEYLATEFTEVTEENVRIKRSPGSVS